jgi:hypothetical protein
MNYKDDEELDTWLAEVDLANDYIKKLAENKLSNEEFEEEMKRKETKK